MKKHILYTALILAFASSFAHAVVTFGSAVDITGNTSDIITSSAGVTVESLTQIEDDEIFLGTVLGGDITSAGAAFTAGDYEAALNSFDFGANASTYQLTGLTVGLEYTVQFFYSDERFNGAFVARDLVIDDGAGNIATILEGQSVTGTFIATDTTQDFALSGNSATDA